MYDRDVDIQRRGHPSSEGTAIIALIQIRSRTEIVSDLMRICARIHHDNTSVVSNEGAVADRRGLLAVAPLSVGENVETPS